LKGKKKRREEKDGLILGDIALLSADQKEKLKRGEGKDSDGKSVAIVVDGIERKGEKKG